MLPVGKLVYVGSSAFVIRNLVESLRTSAIKQIVGIRDGVGLQHEQLFQLTGVLEGAKKNKLGH